MPNSYIQYVGNGVTLEYDIPFPYLDKEDVHLMIDDAGRAFTWVNNTRIKIVGTPPILNSIITIDRQTGRNTRKVVFENASILDKTSLNRANTQAFYLSQEAFEEISKQATGEYMFTPLQYDLNTLQGVLTGSIGLNQLDSNIFSVGGDTPFTYIAGSLGINGNLVTTGSVHATALHASDVYTLNIQSSNWPSSGYVLDAINNTFQIGGQYGGIANPGMYWDGTELNIRGNVTFIDPSAIVTQLGLDDIGGDIPASLVELDPTAATKLAGIATNADKTSTVDLAAQINASVTKIAGGQIVTGSVTALQVASRTLTADRIVAGAITANEIHSETITGDRIVGHTITAAKIAAETITVAEIWGLARINGNRLNVVATGSVVVPSPGTYATVTHNLGRYAVACVGADLYMGTAIGWTDHHDANSFRVHASNFSTFTNMTIYYSYI